MSLNMPKTGKKDKQMEIKKKGGEMDDWNAEGWERTGD